MFLLVVLTCIVVLVVSWLLKGKDDRLPPGPKGWPILGYIPYMTSKPYADFTKLANIYGPVFSLKLGSQPVICLNDFASIKEAFAQDAFLGRPPESAFQANKETIETQAITGLPWKEQRRLSLRVLRDLGFGKSKLNNMVKEEINELLAHFEESLDRPISVRPLLTPSTSNNISSLFYGRRMQYDDPDRILLDQAFSEFSASAGRSVWKFFFPWAKKVVDFFGIGGEGRVEGLLRKMKEFARKEISKHEETLDENNIRDYIDGYLLEIQKNKDKAFCKPVLEDLFGLFVGGGSDTVRVTIEWLLLTLAAYEDVQSAIQTEIENVIGRDRSPAWNDHLQMPYTEAVIMEIMRWRCVIPINFPRYTLWTTELNGYVIPKGSTIMANLWAVLHNPEYWGQDAEIFRPERFLTDDGKAVVKPEYFIPFSTGKRSCPGETFARFEIFLYLVCILQKFQVSLPEGTIPDFEGMVGLSLAPKPFEICIRKRH